MKIAIIGTRGIPNHYGGFEQCAEYLAAGLVEKGFEILVYNSHNHPYTKSEWNGVKIAHCYDPEYKWGTVGQFIYDLNCILDLKKQKVDIILQLGYTSGSIWGWLLPKNAVVTTNMDGLEWKRTKYSSLVKNFLLFAERLGVKFSDHLISDSIGIQEYLKSKYNHDSVFIPYGANTFNNPDERVLANYSIRPRQYSLLIARLEPENSIDVILGGVAKAKLNRIFLVIGKHNTKYGEFLKQKFAGYPYIQFIGAVYDINILNNLRYYASVYFHGHTVGGTNPSLLEAMASSSLICANDNAFNRYILGDDALYFNNEEDVRHNLVEFESKSDPAHQKMKDNNVYKINHVYTWEQIIDKYATHLKSIKGKFARSR